MLCFRDRTYWPLHSTTYLRVGIPGNCISYVPASPASEVTTRGNARDFCLAVPRVGITTPIIVNLGAVQDVSEALGPLLSSIASRAIIFAHCLKANSTKSTVAGTYAVVCLECDGRLGERRKARNNHPRWSDENLRAIPSRTVCSVGVYGL